MLCTTGAAPCRLRCRRHHAEPRRLRALSADVRPLAGPPARAADRAPRRRVDLGQARRLQLGLAFGGNKTRKLEYLVADALAKGCDTLVSIGGVQSNHTRQVAAVARAPGSAACSCRRAGSTGRTSSTTASATSMLSRIMGADVRLVQAGFGIGFKQSWEQAIARHRGGRAARPTRSRPAPPTIRSAASALPAGRARSSEQERELGVFFDTIIVCAVTGSTHAGMVAGFARAGEAAPRDRHRRLGEAGRDARPGRAHRTQHGRR